MSILCSSVPHTPPSNYGNAQAPAPGEGLVEELGK